MPHPKHDQAHDASERTPGPCCPDNAPSTLVAIPVYNEERYVPRVIERVLEQTNQVLVIDDGSTDRTPCLLPLFPVEVIRHARNRGYGHSLLDAFRWADVDGYDWIITMDCDEQHEPSQIPDFLDAIARDDLDVISGSRYLAPDADADQPPPERRAINATITHEVNDAFGLTLTDAFCGFKAYRVSALRALHLDVNGYELPMQFWAQAAAAGLRIGEIPVKLIYNDLNRSFGGPLDDPEIRLAHYRTVLQREIDRARTAVPCVACASGLPECP